MNLIFLFLLLLLLPTSLLISLRGSLPVGSP
jgi:hypothetical protein